MQNNDVGLIYGIKICTEGTDSWSPEGIAVLRAGSESSQFDPKGQKIGCPASCCLTIKNPKPGAEEIALGLLRQTLKRWQESGAQVADLALSASHPLRSLVDPLAPEDKGSRDIIFIRVQDRAVFLSSIRPLLEERASAVGLQVTIRFAEDGHEVTVGDGERLRLEMADSDLVALLYNGCRLPGLRSEGGLTAEPDDSDLLRKLFPDSGACRCALDGY